MYRSLKVLAELPCESTPASGGDPGHAAGDEQQHLRLITASGSANDHPGASRSANDDPGASRFAILTQRERRLLLSVAQAVIPAGSRLPGASPETVARLEALLSTLPAPAVAGYRALLLSLEAHALVRHRESLATLPPAAIEALCSSWQQGGLARRSALRGLLSPLKFLHFGDPAMYERLGCPYPTPVQRTAADLPRGNLLAAADLPHGEVLECDAVVIGSGAGGAVVASELAAAGLAVVILEEGPYFGRADFTGPVIDRQRRLFRDAGGTVAVGNTVIPVPIGRGVGGTTMVNSGTCYRMPARVLHKWREVHGLTDFTDEEMARLYGRVEQVLQVAPAPREFLGGVAQVIARGCDALGYAHGPLWRNAPGCDGQGLCCFGCPTDAKRSVNVSYIPLALRAGAQLVTGARAESLIIEDGRACGVLAAAAGDTPSAPGPGTAGRPFTVKARAVVVAAGALMTPVLLLSDPQARRALARSGQLGRNLSIHPAAGVSAIMPEVVRGFAAIPQGYAIEEFHREGLLMEGVFLPPDLAAANAMQVGRPFMDFMEAYDRVATFGFLLEDESRGRVRPGPRGRPLITYYLEQRDVARLQRGVEILADVFLHAGAQVVLPGVHGFDEIRDRDGLRLLRQAVLSARDFDLTAYHPLGTARMGPDPRTSVVDPSGQAHDLPGLYLCDGSTVPTSPAVNPQMTIMALATRSAEILAARLS